jgi:hypothetical protein
LGVSLKDDGKFDDANISLGIIYWHDRKVTRPGLRNFLKLYVSITNSHNRGQPEWQIIYEQNVGAYRIALERFGLRFGKHLSKADRARVMRLLIDKKTGLVKKPQPWGAYIWSKGA